MIGMISVTYLVGTIWGQEGMLVVAVVLMGLRWRERGSRYTDNRPGHGVWSNETLANLVWILDDDTPSASL